MLGNLPSRTFRWLPSPIYANHSHCSSFCQVYRLLEEGNLAFLISTIEARLPEFRAFRPGFAAVEDKKSHLEVRVGNETHRVPVDENQRTKASLARKRLVLSESEAQALLLFKQFLVSATDDITAHQLEARSTDVVDNFVVWYWDERLYLVRCIRSLLRIRDSDFEADEDKKVADKLLSQLQVEDEKSYSSQCVEYVQGLATQPLPVQLRENLRDANLAAEQRLRLQLEILDAVSIYCYNFRICDAATCVALLTFVSKTSFAQHQVDASFHTTVQAQKLIQAVASLATLVCVESVNIESLLQEHPHLLPPATTMIDDPPASGAASLAASPTDLNEVLDLIGLLDPCPYWAPVCLAYALVLNRIEAAMEIEQSSTTDGSLPSHLDALARTTDPGPGEEPIWTKLAQFAFRPSSQLNKTITEILTTLEDVSHQNLPNPSQAPYRGLIKGLLLAETELVQPNFIHDTDDLLLAWQCVLGHVPPHHNDPLRGAVAHLAHDFWEVDYPQPTHASFFNMTVTRWPLMFQPYVALLTGLSGRQTEPVQGSSFEWRNDAACAAVNRSFLAFGRIKKCALFLPPERVIGNPYEAVIDPDTAELSYRLVQPMHVFGLTALPAGSIGEVVSDTDAARPVISWSTPYLLSGWRITRDVLAHVMGLYPNAGSLEGLLADTSPAALEQITLVALQLFAAVMSASKPSETELLDKQLPQKLPPEMLLNHLDGLYEPLLDEDEDEDLFPRPKGVSLVAIVLAVLSKALSTPTPAYNVSLISTAYELLCYLLPYCPSELWQALRPKNIALGSADLVPIRAREGILPETVVLESKVLQTCKMAGRYTSLLSLLDLQIALLKELAQSQFAAPAELLETKVFVSRRVLYWMIEQVWADALNWRYVQPEERTAVLHKCLIAFNNILADTAIGYDAAAKEGAPAVRLQALTMAMDQAFLSPRSTVTCTAPLISILGCSATLVNDGAKESPQAKLEAESLLNEAWQCAIRLVTRRRDVNRRLLPSMAQLGPIELAIFNPALVPAHLAPPIAAPGALKAFARSRPTDKTQVAAALVDSILDVHISYPATLLSNVVISAAEVAQRTRVSSPALLGSLGSLSDTQDKLSQLTSLAATSTAGDFYGSILTNCRLAVWELFSALAEHQPSLAAVLILGEHPNYSHQLPPEPASAEVANKGKAPEAAPDLASSSALDIAVKRVLNWTELWNHQMPLLVAILKFLVAVWARAPEHEARFRNLLQQPALWQALRALISADVGLWTEEELSKDELKVVVALRQACQTCALQVLTTTLTYPLRPSGKNGQGAVLENVKVLLDLLKDQQELPHILTRVTTITMNTYVLTSMYVRISELVHRLPMEAFRWPVMRDRFDGARSYGDNYVWDVVSLSDKLTGYRTADPGNLRAGDGLDVYGAFSAAEAARRINIEWSALDAQILLVRSWNMLLTQAMGPIRRLVGEGGPAQVHQSAVHDALSAAWTRVTQHIITAAEQADSLSASEPSVASCQAFRNRILRAQVALSSALLEFGWKKITGPSAPEVERMLSNTRLVKQLNDLVRPQTEESIASTIASLAAPSAVAATADTPLHPPLFRMVLLTLLHCRQVIVARKAQGSIIVKDGQHNEVHSAVDTFALSAVPALQQVVKVAVLVAATPLPADPPLADEYHSALVQIEPDLGILTGILNLLVRPSMELMPHHLNALFAKEGLLIAMVELLRAVPIGDAREPLWGKVALDLLGVLLTIAENPHLAESLLSAGILTALLNNALTPALERGQLRDLPNGQEATAHACWLGMLRIVVALEKSFAAQLRPSSHTSWVLLEIYSLASYYRAQLGHIALKFRPASFATAGARPAHGSLAHPGTVSFASTLALPPTIDGSGRASPSALEETELTLYLYCAMAHAATGEVDASRKSFLRTAARDVAIILQQCTYLLLRPGHRVTAFGIDGVEESNPREARIYQDMQETVADGLLRTARAAVAFLVDLDSVPEWLANPLEHHPTFSPTITPVRIFLSWIFNLN